MPGGRPKDTDTAPSTLDLAERAALGLNYMTETILPDLGYEMYFGSILDAKCPPRSLEGGFGKRIVAFFESPGGLVFEALKIIEPESNGMSHRGHRTEGGAQ